MQRSLHKRPTAEESAAFDAHYQVGEQIISIGADVGIGLLTLDEAIEKIRALKSTLTGSLDKNRSGG